VFRIHIELYTDPDPAFQVNTDPDPAPDSDPGFFMTKMKEFVLEKLNFYFQLQISINTLIEDPRLK